MGDDWGYGGGGGYDDWGDGGGDDGGMDDDDALQKVLAESMGDGMGGLGMKTILPMAITKPKAAEEVPEASAAAEDTAEVAEEEPAEKPAAYKMGVFVVADPSRSLPEECDMMFDSEGISVTDTSSEALLNHWNWSWILQVVYNNPAAEAAGAGITAGGNDLEELMDEFVLYIDEDYDEQKSTQKYIFEVEDGADALKWCKLYMPVHHDLEKGLRPSQISYLRAMFYCLDLTGEGLVSSEEIKLVLKADANSNPLLEYDEVDESCEQLFKILGLTSKKSLTFEVHHTLLSYTPLIHSSHTLIHSSHILLSYTPLIHSSHTLLSYTPLIYSLVRSSHTLLSYTPLIYSLVRSSHRIS
jgi:hypothetical protein